MSAESDRDNQGASTSGGISESSATKIWSAIALSSQKSIKELLLTQEFRVGVMALGRDQSLLSAADRLSAILLLLKLEKAGKEGKQLSNAVMKPVISTPPSTLTALKCEKDQLLLIQSLEKKSIGWLATYLSNEIWVKGLSKKVVSTAAGVVLRKSATWAIGIEEVVKGGMAVETRDSNLVDCGQVEYCLQGFCASIESSVALPGINFYMGVEQLVELWERFGGRSTQSKKSTKLIAQFVRLIRLATQARPLLLQQNGLIQIMKKMRHNLPGSKWHKSVEKELIKLKNVVADRIAIDAGLGVANLELFSTLESMFEKRSDALACTARLVEFVPTAPEYLLDWIRNGILEAPKVVTDASDEHLVAALYIRASTIFEEFDKGAGPREINVIRAMCVEIEQMAQNRNLELVWKKGEIVDYSPLTQLFIEGANEHGDKVLVEVPAVGKRSKKGIVDKIVLPAWVRAA